MSFVLFPPAWEPSLNFDNSKMAHSKEVYLSSEKEKENSCFMLTSSLNVKVGRLTIVVRGDWLCKATNVRYKNDSTAVHVGSSQTVYNPLFSFGKL